MNESRIYRRATSIFIVLASVVAALNGRAQSGVAVVQAKSDFADPREISVKGLLGDALSVSRQGRLRELPRWKNGELIRMFTPEVRDQHDKTDWYGEHAGKWLYTTAMAVRQTGDADLKNLLLATADELVTTQAADGYLGVYSPAIRITNNDAMHNRSWDVWNLTLMTLGMLE